MVKIGITKRKGDKESKGNGDVPDGIHKDRWIEVLRREIVLELHVDQERNGHVKTPAKQFLTLLISPQLQACYRDLKTTWDMAWLWKKTEEVIQEFWHMCRIFVIEDIAMGLDYLSAVLDGNSNPQDIVLMVSLDGA